MSRLLKASIIFIFTVMCASSYAIGVNGAANGSTGAAIGPGTGTANTPPGPNSQGVAPNSNSNSSMSTGPMGGGSTSNIAAGATPATPSEPAGAGSTSNMGGGTAGNTPNNSGTNSVGQTEDAQ